MILPRLRYQRWVFCRPAGLPHPISNRGCPMEMDAGGMFMIYIKKTIINPVEEA